MQNSSTNSFNPWETSIVINACNLWQKSAAGNRW